MQNKKILSLLTVICCLVCTFSASTTVFAQTSGETYLQENYDKEILSCLSEEYVAFLQAMVDEIRKDNIDISENELNLFIMDNIQNEYYQQNKARINLPTSQDILNDEEETIFISNPVAGLFAVSCAYTATEWTNNLFDSSVTYLGNGDAYRHSFWQAILAEAYGVDYAKRWGDAHESETTNIIDKTMDLINNDIGRELGASITGYQQIEARLSSLLLTKIANGELWRVVNGQLCTTDGTGRK